MNPLCHVEGKFQEDHYMHIYFEAIDLIVNCITERFNQPGFLIYQHVENLLLKAANCKEYQSELKFVLEFYGSDLDGSSLAPSLKYFLLHVNHHLRTYTNSVINYS